MNSLNKEVYIGVDGSEIIFLKNFNRFLPKGRNV
jgi:hypothetical protein